MTAKRVLFIDHTAMLGGGEIALLNLIRHLDRSKFTPIVLLFEDGPLAEKLRAEAAVYVMPLDRQISDTRKDSLGFRSLLKIGAIFRVFWFVIRVARFIAWQRVDLVHTNTLKSDIIGGLAARLALRPVVWHVRDRIDRDYLPRAVVWWFREIAKVVPSHVIANSAATMKTLYLRQDLSTAVPSGFDLQRLSVVHDGVAAGQVGGERAASVNLGLIGRISPWKGQHIFIRAAAATHSRMPGARFYIIGGALFGEHEYESEIRRLVAELGLSEVVEFTGFCTNVTERIEQLDIVVHASTSGEPFGQVIIEGMAAGKPVIATNGGGVPEIVLDRETGVLVPMGDVSEMAEAMIWMIGHRREAEEMGRKGRERVIKEFTLERSTLKVEAVFARVLGKR